jgi:His/Glu/Gln/Arg/opine family amino acid ABC transporter permease subunit
MNWDLLLREITDLGGASLINIYFALIAIPIGFVLAILLALGKASGHPLISSPSRLYIYVFRGSPFFIQLFAIYSLMLSFNLSLWKPLGWDNVILHPLFLGPAILALNTTAYAAEIFHGAMRTVPRGEVDAARAFGMSRMQRFRAIVWPHLIRIAWPAYTNEVVFLFQATALIYFTLPVIGGQQDLLNRANDLVKRDFNLFLHFGVAAAYFLLISLLIFSLFGLIYRRLTRHMPRAAVKFSVRRLLN